MHSIARLLGVLVLTCAPAATAQTAGGPDGGDYVFGPATYDFLPLASITLAVPLPVGDDAAVTVALPWSFPFYDGLYSTVRVGANGGLSFSSSGGVTYANQGLPSTAPDSPDIAAFWDDLNPGQAGGVYSFHEWVDTNADGTPEIDRFVMSWEDVPHYYNIGAASFQVQLYPNGEIEVHWQDTVFGSASYNYGASATVGIQDFSAGLAWTGRALEASVNSSWVGDGSATVFQSCPSDSDGDGSPDCLDCDDTNPAIYPQAEEVCDGVDNDCDLSTNEAVSSDSDGQSICAGDCDDNDPANFSGNGELCDLSDNDCDGSIDENFDADGDGFINLYEPACAATYLASLLDCEDADPLAYPGAPEICDGLIDHDCDGQIDEGSIVRVGGGVGTPLPLLGVASLSRNIVLADPGTVTDVDVTVNVTHGRSSDLDIYLVSPFGTRVELSTDNGGTGGGYSGTVFDDEAESQIIAGVAPFSGSYQPEGSLSVLNNQFISGTWTLEITDDDPASEDGILGNWTLTISADGATDDDGDGYTLCQGDCDDQEDTIHPQQTEVCDGLDNDCDGSVDDGSVDGDGDGWADCPGGDCDDSAAGTFPGSFEVCDGADNDCNGLDDAESPDVTGQETDDDGDGYVECGLPSDPFPGGDCNDGDPSESPGLPELCDGGTDNDCDPATVEDVDADGDGESVCDGDCDDTDPLNSGGTPEACDALDNDCDGAVDEDFDQDGDGVFDSSVPGCVASWDTVDCDDSDGFNLPGNPEICDGSDNNCDGLADNLIEQFDGAASGNIINGSGGLNVTAVVGVEVASVPVAGYLLDLDVSVDISHSAVQDVELALISPSGTVVLLTSDNGGFGVDFSGTTFDDEAAATIQNSTGDDAPFPGRFIPEEALSAFDGETVSGVWTLNIVDDFPGANDGVLNSWSLSISWEGDGDGSFTLCVGGDCDDLDPARSPLLVEICDGIDNDCDGFANFDALLETDNDGDGAYSCADCDDGDSSAYPGALEFCDGIDNDCDPTTDESADGDGDGLSPCTGDCNDTTALVFSGAPEICDGLDNDCDGVFLPAEQTDDDGDGSFACADCDEGDPAQFPGNLEICDGQDNDCDLTTDESGDNDGDGMTPCEGDCDDTEPSTHTGALELCDGLDNDCDGVTDPSEFIDTDSDGSFACSDCNDLDVSNFPGNTEVCDGQDNDCDLTTDESYDSDSDGYTICDGDCDDALPELNPSEEEICDGLNNDCQSSTDEDIDSDGDGFTLCDGDCDDSEASVNPLASEACDGVDTNCDGNPGVGESDADGDGVLACEGDCAPTDPDTWPGAPEICDGVDNDCDDDLLDEETDEDNDGFAPCSGDCDDTESSAFPGSLELCDGIDNNCDGVLPQSELDPDEDGWSACEGDCYEQDASVHPGASEDSAETCSDGMDNDCDGKIDDDDDDCDNAGDDDDSADDGDDDDSADEATEACACSASLLRGGPSGIGFSLGLLLLALTRRRATRSTPRSARRPCCASP